MARNVVLFGSGAVLDWHNAPSTPELTELVRKSGFVCNDNNKITEFIFQKFIESGYNNDDITFETIINVLEELMVYYSSFNKEQNTSSIQKIFMDSKFEENLLNFSIEGGLEKHGYKLEIPKGKEYQWQHLGALNNETPSQFFFQQLLALILTEINAAISKYGFHIDDTNSNIFNAKNERINSLLINWIDHLKHANNILRFYTLNYERNFKILAIKGGINDMFEGFDCGEILHPNDFIPPNIPRILGDFDCHCHYNLHGSIFWGIKPRDEKQLPNAEFFLYGVPHFPLNLTEQPYIQIEKGKSILISNIITGYQKAQKGFIPPYRQMQSAFDKDCIDADNLFIIGYSFSDEHINMSIKTAIKYNKKIKIHIVDPAYDERDGNKGYSLLQARFIDIFTPYLSARFNCEKITETSCQYFNDKLVVHTVKFKEFLENLISDF